MKRVIVLLAGLITGVLLSGIGAALLVPFVPERWRGAILVWTLTAAVTILTMTMFGVLFTKRDE